MCYQQTLNSKVKSLRSHNRGYILDLTLMQNYLEKLSCSQQIKN